MNQGAYLTGKHAIVTGGGGGIGRTISTELAFLGANLTLIGRNREALLALAQELSDGYSVGVEAATCDVSDERAVKEVFAHAEHRFGVAYVLVNNAGCGEACQLRETSRELWDRTMAVNLTGTFLCSREVLPAMATKGEGRIVNISSTAGLKGYRDLSAYCASKHGIIGLTRALAMEVAAAGVTVNSVCPAYVAETGMGEHAIENVMKKVGTDRAGAIKALVRGIPRGKLITPAEVANAVVWLCSPDASSVTGQSIIVAGGEVM